MSRFWVSNSTFLGSSLGSGNWLWQTPKPIKVMLSGTVRAVASSHALRNNYQIQEMKLRRGEIVIPCTCCAICDSSVSGENRLDGGMDQIFEGLGPETVLPIESSFLLLGIAFYCYNSPSTLILIAR